MLIVLSKKNKLDLELVKDTLALKVKIRNFLYERTNDIMKIYIDISKIENIEKKKMKTIMKKYFWVLFIVLIQSNNINKIFFFLRIQ